MTEEIETPNESEEPAQTPSTPDVSKTTTGVERPEYINEAYWHDNQVDIKKMAADFESLKKQVDGYRKWLSQKGPKEEKKDIQEESPESSKTYETLFENREYTEDQRNDLKHYIEIAKKSGLNKQQAEVLLDSVVQWNNEESKARAESNAQKMRDQLGEHYEPLMSEFERFGQQQVNQKNWTESQKHAFDVMVFDADTAKVMTDLIQWKAKDSVNFASFERTQGNTMNWEDVYEMAAEGYKLKARGHIDEGEKLIRKSQRLRDQV